jgi:hypothetical protein
VSLEFRAGKVNVNRGRSRGRRRLKEHRPEIQSRWWRGFSCPLTRAELENYRSNFILMSRVYMNAQAYVASCELRKGRANAGSPCAIFFLARALSTCPFAVSLLSSSTSEISQIRNCLAFSSV